MMSADVGELWEGRPVLARQEVMLVRGVLFIRGTLTLFSDEMQFEPIRGIDRLAGAQELRFQVEDVEDVEGDSQELTFAALGKEFEFRGRGAGFILARLDALLQQRAGVASAGAPFAEDEQVLVQGPLESHINALLSAKGTVLLTTRRFRFDPDGFMNRLVGAGLALEVPLSEVESIEVVAVRRLLKVRIGGVDHLYAGALVPVLYSRLLGLLSLGVGAGEDDPDRLLATWSVALAKGPLSQSGSLLVSTGQMLFTVEGGLDSVLGLHSLSMPIVEIDRLGGSQGKGVVVTCEGEVRRFSMSQAEERLRDLFALLLQFRDPREPERDEPAGWSGEGLDLLISRLAPDTSLRNQETVFLAGPSLQWLSEATVRRGVLVVTSQRLFFLPSSRREKPLMVELSELRRVPFGEELTTQLQMVVGRRHLRFSPRGRSFFIERFWATVETIVGQVGTPEPEFDEAQPPSEQHSVTLEFLPRNLGEVKYIAVRYEGRLVKRIEPAQTIREADGLGLFYPGLPGAEFTEGNELSFELGRADGIYRFTTTLLRIESAESISGGDDAVVDEVGGGADERAPLRLVRDDHFLLVVKYPEDLRFLNRRLGFRVPFDVLSRVREMAADEKQQERAAGSWFRCTIEELAVIGCSIRTTREVAVGTQLVIEIPLRDRVITVDGRCVRRAADDGSGRPPLLGFRFDRVGLADEDVLHLALTRLQRQSLPLRG
ncbi:MAG: hypothetical protein CMP23_15730 [Rickettsiales bacterium]|nr:hypothetical protein [Rickettsiales bacterium]